MGWNFYTGERAVAIAVGPVESVRVEPHSHVFIPDAMESAAENALLRARGILIHAGNPNVQLVAQSKKIEKLVAVDPVVVEKEPEEALADDEGLASIVKTGTLSKLASIRRKP